MIYWRFVFNHLERLPDIEYVSLIVGWQMMLALFLLNDDCWRAISEEGRNLIRTLVVDSQLFNLAAFAVLKLTAIDTSLAGF